MGLYDTLGKEEQVKCFYAPSFWDGEIGHMGGSLKHYKIGDCVPINTLYYNYPPDFIIVDYRNLNNNLNIIKDGVLDSQQKMSDLNEILPKPESFLIVVPVYNNFGEKIKINTFKDILDINKDFNKKVDDFFTTRGKMTKNSGLTLEFSDNEKKEYFKKIKLLKNNFESKWHIVEKDQDLMRFGEIIDCLYGMVDEGAEKNTDANALFDMARKAIKDDKNIIGRYCAWLKINVDFSEDKLVKFLREIIS